MKNYFKENPYTPLPTNIDMRGTYAEIKENDKTRFFEISYIEYNEKEIEECKKEGRFENSVFDIFLQYIDINKIDAETYFIYNLETYYATPHLEEPEDFYESITDLEVYGFIHFMDMMNFCKERWGLEMKDFVRQHNTSMPQF